MELGVMGNNALINPIIFKGLANDFMGDEKNGCQHFLQVVKAIRLDFSTGWRDWEPGISAGGKSRLRRTLGQNFLHAFFQGLFGVNANVQCFADVIQGFKPLF